MNPPPLIVIFGAAVRPDGSPSEALLRRTGYGLAASRRWPDAPILCSGGAVRGEVSEASIMGTVLREAGVAPGRLILDQASRDTLENVDAVAAEVTRGGHPYVIACSDRYHLARVRLLLRLAGVTSRPGHKGQGPPLPHELAMTLREALAIPHSLARLIFRRFRP